MNEYEKLLYDNYKIDKNVIDFVEAAEKEINEQLQTFVLYAHITTTKF